MKLGTGLKTDAGLGEGLGERNLRQKLADQLPLTMDARARELSAMATGPSTRISPMHSRQDGRNLDYLWLLM